MKSFSSFRMALRAGVALVAAGSVSVLAQDTITTSSPDTAPSGTPLATAPVGPTTMPFIDVGPPNSHNGIAFRELFEQPDQWAVTRSKTNELLYADWAMRQFSDDDLKKWFAQLKQWNIKLELEVGAIKEWGQDGKTCFDKERAQWDRIVRLGGHIDSVAMDEPLCCVRKLKKGDEYAATETANFIAQVRQYFPDTAVVEIEPYPYVQSDDLKTWLDSLQKALAAINVKGLDGFRLDVNWIVYAVAPNQKGSWLGVKKVEEYCRSVKLPFSLVYWAPGFEMFAKNHVGDDATWYHLVMGQAYAYAAAGGHPDQYCVESWVNAPAHSVPETDIHAFTRSANDLYDQVASKVK